MEWYYSYLGRRHLEVSLHGETVHLTTGTGFPQGRVCSARFWLIAFDKAIQIINSRGIVGNGYADDCSALLGGTHSDNMIESMQAMLDELVAWGLSCGLRFNAQKTIAVMFSKSNKTFSRQVRMDGALIPYSETVVYLGVTLDAKLSWSQHVTLKVKKAKALLLKLSSITRSYWGPQPKLMKWAYTGMVRPVISYAALAWGCKIEEEHIENELRRLNRAAINSIVRTPRSTPTRAMEIILDIFPLHLFIMKEGIAAYHRLQRQSSLQWDGITLNYTSAVSHLRFWDYLSHDMGLQESDGNSDRCLIMQPTRRFVLDLESFVNMADCQGQVECNVYTDGSKFEGQVGAGLFILMENTPPIRDKFRLPDECTVFQAEVLAIREAAKLLVDTPNLKRVKFFVDSQAALRALQNIIVKSKLVLKTVLYLNRIQAQSIVFVWTKAHIGTAGNEEADVLAKAGTKATPILPVPLPANDLDGDVKACIRKKWDSQWKLHRDCRQSKLFHPCQDKELSDSIITWPRIKLGRYIRAVTGHNNLLYHLHNMYSFISPICRFCGDAYEEFFHLAYMCPALWNERHYINSLDKDHFNDWTPDQVIEFALIPKIDEAFVKPLFWVEDERELLEVPSQSLNEDDIFGSDSEASVMDTASLISTSSSSPSSDYNTD